MKTPRRPRHRTDLPFPGEAELSALIGAPGRLVTVTFRQASVIVLAGHDRAAQRARGPASAPVTDVLHLELLSGPGEAPGWLRPVASHLMIEVRADPLLAVHRASRWASYAARLAVVPEDRLCDQVLVEAALLGVWVVAAGDCRGFRTVVVGEPGPVAGSARGLPHRLLDELIWAELDRADEAGAG
jgi:hypothetical protein